VKLYPLDRFERVICEAISPNTTKTNPMVRVIGLNFTPFNGHLVKEIFDIELRIQLVTNTPMLNEA